MRARPLSTLAAAALVAGACSSGLDSAVFMSAPPQPAGAEVRIYQTTMPTCAYDELGVVTWRPTDGWKKLEGGVERMRERARQMGGHAIVAFSVGARPAASTTTTVRADSAAVIVGSSVTTETLATGTVIRFRESGCLP